MMAPQICPPGCPLTTEFYHSRRRSLGNVARAIYGYTAFPARGCPIARRQQQLMMPEALWACQPRLTASTTLMAKGRLSGWARGPVLIGSSLPAKAPALCPHLPFKTVDVRDQVVWTFILDSTPAMIIPERAPNPCLSRRFEPNEGPRALVANPASTFRHQKPGTYSVAAIVT